MSKDRRRPRPFPPMPAPEVRRPSATRHTTLLSHPEPEPVNQPAPEPAPPVSTPPDATPPTVDPTTEEAG
jgi:hypothetical protein